MATCLFDSDANVCPYLDGQICKAEAAGCGMRYVEPVRAVRTYKREERWYEKYYRARERKLTEEERLCLTVEKKDWTQFVAFPFGDAAD